MSIDSATGAGSFGSNRRTDASNPLTLGRRLRDASRGRAKVGTFVIELPNPTTITILAHAGFDFAVLDLEHSSYGFERLEALITAAHAVRLPVIVRPWDSAPGLIGKILDLGANGIMAPHVSSAQDARRIVESCRYGGTAGRGLSPLCRFASLDSQVKDLNEATFVVVQVEGAEGLAALPEISQVDGLDAIFFGPYDLTLGLGLEQGDNAVFSAIENAMAKCDPATRFGIYLDNIAASANWADKNVTLQCLGFDGRMLLDGAHAILSGGNTADRDAKL